MTQPPFPSFFDLYLVLGCMAAGFVARKVYDAVRARRGRKGGRP